jgi:prevent-host-death family protein
MLPSAVNGSIAQKLPAARSEKLSHMTKSVGVHEAKTNLSRLLDEVANGQEIEITNRGRAVARLVPVQRRMPHYGFDAGRVWIAEDFDAPMPKDLLAEFER